MAWLGACVRTHIDCVACYYDDSAPVSNEISQSCLWCGCMTLIVTSGWLLNDSDYVDNAPWLAADLATNACTAVALTFRWWAAIVEREMYKSTAAAAVCIVLSGNVCGRRCFICVIRTQSPAEKPITWPHASNEFAHPIPDVEARARHVRVFMCLCFCLNVFGNV